MKNAIEIVGARTNNLQSVNVSLPLHKATLPLRMGLNTGPVYRRVDINTNLNVAGSGINMAQRVMDCGDSGHILLSKRTADVLSELGGWDEQLHDLGEAEVKHGVKIHLYNFYNETLGNPAAPAKLAGAPKTHSESDVNIE